MIKNPAIASLDSAKGPSVTAFLPATILPLCSNGCPLLKFPAFFRRSNHEVNLAILFWISSGERSLGQLVPRKSSKYSEVVVFAVIINDIHFLNIRRTRSDDQDGLYDFLVPNRPETRETGNKDRDTLGYLTTPQGRRRRRTVFAQRSKSR